MKIILYMAMPVNGMIARKNGDEDFLSHENWEKFESLAKEQIMEASEYGIRGASQLLEGLSNQ